MSPREGEGKRKDLSLFPGADLWVWKRTRMKAERMERSMMYSLAYRPQSTYLHCRKYSWIVPNIKSNIPKRHMV
jgi:hypothetical protein